jgi:hypothetical protein
VKVAIIESPFHPGGLLMLIGSVSRNTPFSVASVTFDFVCSFRLPKYQGRRQACNRTLCADEPRPFVEKSPPASTLSGISGDAFQLSPARSNRSAIRIKALGRQT